MRIRRGFRSQLVILRDDAPLPEPIEAFAVKAWDAAVLRDFLVFNNFKSIRHRLGLEDAAAPDAELVPEQNAAPFGPYAVVTAGGHCGAGARIGRGGALGTDG